LEWIGYRQTAVFQCPVIGKPTCFAVQTDSTFIVGTADPPALIFFDNNGTFLRKVDLHEEPRAIVCGTPNTIFTDKIIIAHPKSIVVYSTEGQSEFSLWESSKEEGVISGSSNRHFPRLGTELLDSEQRVDVRSLVLTPDYLFAADTDNRLIYRFTTDDRWNVLRIGNSPMGTGVSGVNFDWLGKPFDGFVVYTSPIVMTYSPATDFLYIANPGRHRVDVFSQDGIYQPELSFGEPSASLSGFAGCCNPVGLAALDDGRILTVEKAVSRVKIFKTDGQLDCVVAGYDILEDTSRKPNQRSFAVAVLSDGSIAVFDFDCAVMRIFESHCQHN